MEQWSSSALAAAAFIRISVRIPTAFQNQGTLFVLRSMEISSEFKDEEDGALNSLPPHIR